MKRIILALALIGLGSIAADEGMSMSETDKALYSADENPGDLFVAKGEELFVGYGGKEAFASWLGVNEKNLGKELATYPKYSKKTNSVASLETLLMGFAIDTKKQNINPGDEQSIFMIAYLKSLANGEKVNMPLNDAALQKALKKGKVVFDTKRGARGLSCYDCHNPGVINRRLRMQNLPDIAAPDIKTGATWPAYRMTKTEMTTLQKRFQGCMDNSSQAKLPIGSSQMVDMEAYVTSLSQGQTISIPGLKR